ncbi:MAG: FkbM family methyltransferase [Chloracidobacterium sp.]
MKSWRTLRTIWTLATHARSGLTWRDRWLAFLLAGLVSLGERRARARAWFLERINAHAQNGQVTLRLRIGTRACSFAMRQGDREDFLIGGELVKGAYPAPPFTPRQIVDGGANIGMFGVLAKALFPDARLVCFEPDEKNLVQLRHNFAANGIVADIHPVGLWSRETTLYYHPGTSYGGYIDEQPPGIPIPCVVPRIDADCWLKLDIEGSEYEVLPRLLADGAYPRWISMEIHDFNRRGSALLALLRQHGYEISGDVSPGLSCTTVEAWRNAADSAGETH